MDITEFVKLLLAAIVGAVLKEIAAWLVSVSKPRLFGPMFTYSRSVFGSILACGFQAIVLVRFGLSQEVISRQDILIVVGCSIFLLVCLFDLLVHLHNWKNAYTTVNAKQCE